MTREIFYIQQTHIRCCFSFYERRFLECGFFSVGRQVTRDTVIVFVNCS